MFGEKSWQRRLPEVVTGVLAVTFAVSVGFRLSDGSSSTNDSASSSVLSRTPEVAISTAAQQATRAFLDIDYRDMAPRMSAILSLSTGKFYRQYKSSEQRLTMVAQQAKIVSVGTVRYVGLGAIGSRSARAYVAADSSVSASSTPSGTPAQQKHRYRLQLDLTWVKGAWLVNDLKFV